MEEFQRLTLMLPRYWLSHFLLARVYVETFNPERSIQPFGEAIRLNPEFSTLYDYRATAYETLGGYELSLKDYDSIIESKPTHSALTQRAIALYALGRLEETVTAFQDAITLLQVRIGRATSDEEVIRFNAYLSLAHNNRGRVLQEVGQIEKTLEDYTEAIRLNPQLSEAFYNRATAFAVLGKIIEAKQRPRLGRDLRIRWIQPVSREIEVVLRTFPLMPVVRSGGFSPTDACI